MVYIPEKTVTESNTQRIGGYTSYNESSYPVAGGAVAMITTEHSRVRLRIRVAICIRNAGGSGFTIFNEITGKGEKLLIRSVFGACISTHC